MITKERVRDQLTNIEITAWELANARWAQALAQQVMAE
jgi:hypothetical protein